MGTLYLVATPIGNLEDVTLRSLRVLSQVELIAAEDTRRTRKLLSHYQIRTPLLSYHEHNKLTRLDRVLAALEGGDVALVSDAGTPLLSDPGYELVAAARAGGHAVSPIPGASAVLAALTASGLPTDQFVFLGYPPRRPSERRRWLAGLQAETRTMILFEAPHRLAACLEDLRRALGGSRQAAVCREMTQVHESILDGSLDNLALAYSRQTPKGECTVVLAGSPTVPNEAWEEGHVRQEVRRLLRHGLGAKQVASRVALDSGWPRNRVYALALEER